MAAAAAGTDGDRHPAVNSTPKRPHARLPLVPQAARGPWEGRETGILVGMTKPRAAKRHLPSSPFKAPVVPPSKLFAVGNRVTHDVYGMGRVTSVDDGISVLVDFGSVQKRIASPYAKMTGL